MKKLKELIGSLNPSQESSTKAKEATSENEVAHSMMSIEENKDSREIRVSFHPDVFLVNSLDLLDEPPMGQRPNRNTFPLELKQFSNSIIFDCTVSPVLCSFGCVRVRAQTFEATMKTFEPTSVQLRGATKREYYYLPMLVALPDALITPGPFEESMVTPSCILCLSLLCCPSSPDAVCGRDDRFPPCCSVTRALIPRCTAIN